MIGLKSIWKRLTHTKALDDSSGWLETAFFGDVYRFLYITGFSTADHGIPYLIYSFTAKLLIVLVIVAELIFMVTESSTLDEVAASMNGLVIQVITTYRYGKMIYHDDIYKKLARSMESPYFDTSTVGRRNFINYWARKNERYMQLLYFLGVCALAPWFLYPLLDDLEYNLFIIIKLPFDYRTPNRYVMVYIGCVVALMFVAHFVMVNDLLMQAHLLHLICQFAVLGDCFENILKDCEVQFEGVDRNILIKNDRFREVYTRRFNDMIKQHQNILSNAIDLRSTLSGPMLGQLAASGTLICLIGYEVVTTGSDDVTKCLRSLMFLCYNLFEFYIFCRWGEEITVKSKGIAEAVYFSNWECGLTEIPGVKASLLLVIARASKPLMLTAGGMYNLSLESYSSLVKTSYSALTVLLRFRQN